ncbi:YhjD/YihY/BrkB family envelope integrity protein, partial [Synechococcus sp. R6-7]
FGQFNQVYRAVGAVIVLLLWVWLTSLALLFGDQINIALYQARKWIAERDP